MQDNPSTYEGKLLKDNSQLRAIIQTLLLILANSKLEVTPEQRLEIDNLIKTG
jgi:hypothetical protein